MSWKVFGHSDLPPTELELEQRQRRKKQIILIAVIILLLLVIGYFGARPAVNVVHGWQARRHAQKAFALIKKEDWGPARDEAVAAYQLRPTEPQAIRAVAQLFSRASQPDGLNFWKQLRDHATLTRADLRDEAGLALRVKEPQRADQAVKELLSPAEGGPAPGDWLLAADLAMQKQDADAALSYVRRVFASADVSERDQLQATIDLDKILVSKQVPDRSEVARHLASLAHSKESAGLDALVALSQQALAYQGSPQETAGIPIDDLIQLLETHPLGKPQHKLLAVDLRIHQHPEQKEALTQKAIDQWKQGDDRTALIALASWLNSHGEYQRELDAIPRERATQNRDLFFQHVDALGALNRWDEIRRLIESEQFPLDPVVEHMYLARCFAQQGQNAGAENNWSRALQAAAGDYPKLMTLGDYAAKNGALEVAGSAYDAAAALLPKARPAQQGRLRAAFAQHDTRKAHDILVELLKIWPSDTAVQNDEAYSRLLLMGSAGDPAELESIEALAEKLTAQEPGSLPHRTLLALVRLKQNRPKDALRVYEGISVPKNALSPSSAVVHAAVLAALGHREEARAEYAAVAEENLLPEERALKPE